MANISNLSFVQLGHLIVRHLEICPIPKLLRLMMLHHVERFHQLGQRTTGAVPCDHKDLIVGGIGGHIGQDVWMMAQAGEIQFGFDTDHDVSRSQLSHLHDILLGGITCRVAPVQLARVSMIV